jgi:uncharacterized protein (DUF1800 family)
MTISFAQAAIRFGYGPGPYDAPSANPRGWLKGQLRGDDPGLASGQFAGLPSGADAVTALQTDARNRRAALLAAGNATLTPDQKAQFHAVTADMIKRDQLAQLGWAATTPAPFRERLVWFWTNHFSTSVQQNEAGPFIGPMMREAIRPHVTGNFTDMVLAVERHPAMLRYLNNDNSIGPNSPFGLRTAKGLNENLGRECMELHTVSLAAGYSQADVTSMAKILTGWSVAPADKGGDSTGFLFRPNTHEPGPQTVMGRTYSSGDEQDGIDALTFLSKYPTTYQFLAKKLVTHFVSDNPPPSAVAHIAAVLRETGGDLGAASAALVDLPAAWVPGAKLKTPFDYVLSILRAAPPPADDPHPVNPPGFLAGLGQPLWGAPLPNGWPDNAANWSGGDAIVTRADFAYTYAGLLPEAAPGPEPADVAAAALGHLLRPATAAAIEAAGSRREALTLLFSSPEFQRR